MLLALLFSLLLHFTTTTSNKQQYAPTFQLHTLQSPVGNRKILSCSGLIQLNQLVHPHPHPHPSFALLKRTDTVAPPTLFALTSGQLPHLNLLDDNDAHQQETYHIIFPPNQHVCQNFILDEYALVQLDNNHHHIEGQKLALTFRTPPLVAIFILQPELTEPPPPKTPPAAAASSASSAQTINSGARKAWKQVLTQVGLPANMTTAPLTGSSTNYGLSNISNIISLMQTHVNHQKTNGKRNTPPASEELDPNIINMAAQEGEAFQRENPFTHTAVHPSSTTGPCMSVTLTFINCVKRHANVQECADHKRDLMNCRSREAAAAPAPATAGSTFTKTANGFSFRACAGAGGGCPASGGTPAGAIAKELGIPARPPVYSPTPLGPDLSDAGEFSSKLYFYLICSFLCFHSERLFFQDTLTSLPFHVYNVGVF